MLNHVSPAFEVVFDAHPSSAIIRVEVRGDVDGKVRVGNIASEGARELHAAIGFAGKGRVSEYSSRMVLGWGVLGLQRSVEIRL